MRLGLALRLLVPVVVATAALAGSAGPARAINMNAVWPELNLPGFRITPFITERAEYQANVLLQPSNELDDFISRTIAGVVVELPFGRHRLDLSARAEWLRFLNNNQFDSEHYFVLGNLALDFPGGLRARLREEFAKTSDPPGTELTGRIDNTTNTVAPEVEYAIAGRFSLGTNYAYSHVRFDSSVAQLDRDEHTAGLTGFWKMTPRSEVLANVSYGVKTFDSATSRDADRYFAMVGLRGELTSRLSSTFRIGYELRDDSEGKSGTVVTSGDWVFVPTERTRFTLLTQRSFEESVFGTNTTFTATVVTLLVQQRFGPKLTFNGRLFVGLNEYPNKDLDVDRFRRRTDWLYGGGVGVDYQIQRWLGVGADYSFAERVSNFRGFDYTDHVLGVKVTLSL
jgi:hypothetical protein